MTEYGYGPDEATLGDRLTLAREAAGLTVSQLAERLEVQAETVDGWEIDQAAPGDEGLARIAAILGVPPLWLLAGTGPGVAPADGAMTELAELRRLLDEAMARLTRLEGIMKNG